MCCDLQDYLVNILLKTARNEHCEGARYAGSRGVENRPRIPFWMFVLGMSEGVIAFIAWGCYVA